jgi:hypothetical protein
MPPRGTGTPAAASSFLVSSLSCAIDSAMALVRPFPQPGCGADGCPSQTSPCCRWSGGGRECCGLRRRRRSSRCWVQDARLRPVRAVGPARLSRSNGRSSRAALHNSIARSNRQAADLFLGIFHHHLEDAGFQRWRGAAEGDRAAGIGLQASAVSSSTWAIEHGVMVAAGLQHAQAGKAGAQPVFEALHAWRYPISSPRSPETASIAKCAGSRGWVHAAPGFLILP